MCGCGAEPIFFLCSFMFMFSNANPSKTQLSFLLCRVWPSHSSRTRPTRRPWTRSRSDSRWISQSCRKKSTSPPISRVDRRHSPPLTSGPEFETSHLFSTYYNFPRCLPRITLECWSVSVITYTKIHVFLYFWFFICLLNAYRTIF